MGASCQSLVCWQPSLMRWTCSQPSVLLGAVLEGGGGYPGRSLLLCCHLILNGNQRWTWYAAWDHHSWCCQLESFPHHAAQATGKVVCQLPLQFLLLLRLLLQLLLLLPPLLLLLLLLPLLLLLLLLPLLLLPLLLLLCVALMTALMCAQGEMTPWAPKLAIGWCSCQQTARTNS